MADFVLPVHHYLENWGDANPRRGLYSLQQPTLAPIHSSRAFQDSLLKWMKSETFSNVGLASHVSDWHGYLQANWKETVYHESGVTTPFETFWESALRVGVYDLFAAQGKSDIRPVARVFREASLGVLPKYSRKDNSFVALALYSSVAMSDGRSANNAWLQELPDPVSSVTWDNYLNVGPELSKKLAIKENDVVTFDLEQGQKGINAVNVKQA